MKNQNSAKLFALRKKRRRKVGCVMRKILLVLTVLLLAAPTWAAISVTCTAVDLGNTYEVRVDYSYSGDANTIRAFGIEIDVNNGAVISNIDVNDSDYYIFPGSIDINDTTGEVDSNGTAVVDYVADANGSFILEMGSLYDVCDVQHPCAPPSSGTLCTFETNKECVVGLTRDTARGGVVNEDGSDSASLSGCTLTYANCLPLGHADWAQYDTVGRPNAWCGKKQCHGDATDSAETFGRDNWVAVGFADFTLLSNGYNDNSYGGDPTVDTWIAADFTHSAEQFGRDNWVRVGFADFTILSTYYNDPCGTVPGDCVP